MSSLLFFLGIIVCASGVVPTPVALVLGLAFGFTLEHPLHAESRRLSHFLLQASVVCLGFGMQLGPIVHAGRAGFGYTALSISVATALGLGLGRLLQVRGKQSLLITMGTAICGGSAIAAIGPVLEAGEQEMAVSLGTVFSLNAVALLVFPPIGHALRLTETQFGLWAALAIHDTSSVVGAGAVYGPVALLVGTTVKLARALWIVPVTFAVAAGMRRRDGGRGRVSWPWFIVLFLGAAVLASFFPVFAGEYAALSKLGRAGLTVVLFLIGTGLNAATLRRVGVRPLLQGFVLWVVVATGSLWAIWRGWIAL